jgi:hypothetical protein
METPLKKRILGTLPLLLLVLGCPSSNRAQRNADSGTVQSKRSSDPGSEHASPDAIASRLDSLAAISSGDYIHLQVGVCFGRCDAYVSLYRDSPAHYHIYEAEGWKFDEQQRDFILFRLRRPLGSDESDWIFNAATNAGLMRLEPDTTFLATDQPHFWLRARIGDRTIAIDNAYLGGEKYMAPPQGGAPPLSKTFFAVRDALLGTLFAGGPVGVRYDPR